MSKKEDDEFASWKAELAKEFESDPDAKAAWETITAKATDKVKERFYRGTLRQDEFHRRLNEVNAEKQQAAEIRSQAEQIVQQSQEWYAMSKPEYEKAVKAKEVALSLLAQHGLLGEGAGGGQPPANGGGRQEMGNGRDEEVEQLKAQLAGVARGLPNFMRDFAVVQTEILRNNWAVDPAAVMDYSSTRGVTLQQALSDLTVDERKKRLDDDIQKRITEGVEEEKRKLLASYPTPDFARGGPRASLADQMKQMEELSNPNTRREAGVALLREALTGGGKA